MDDETRGEAVEPAGSHDDAPDAAPGQVDGPGGGHTSGDVDPLLRVRTELETIDELPLAERAEVFERAHRTVVEELRALDLG